VACTVTVDCRLDWNRCTVVQEKRGYKPIDFRARCQKAANDSLYIRHLYRIPQQQVQSVLPNHHPKFPMTTPWPIFPRSTIHNIPTTQPHSVQHSTARPPLTLEKPTPSHPPISDPRRRQRHTHHKLPSPPSRNPPRNRLCTIISPHASTNQPTRLTTARQANACNRADSQVMLV